MNLFSSSSQPQEPASPGASSPLSERETEKTERRGVAIGCIVLVLFFALLTAAGIWAVKTLLSPMANNHLNAPEHKPSASMEDSSVSAAESLPSPAFSIADDLYAGQYDESAFTLGITLGEFLDAYNAAAPDDSLLDLNDSEALEFSSSDGQSSYYFFLYEAGAGSYVSVILDCLGEEPSLDQPIASLFVSDSFPAESDETALPPAIEAAILSLPGFDEPETILRHARNTSETTAEEGTSIQSDHYYVYYDLLDDEDMGLIRMSLGVFPAS